MGAGIMWSNPNAAFWGNPAAQATDEAQLELENLRYQNYVAIQNMAGATAFQKAMISVSQEFQRKLNHKADAQRFENVDGLDSKILRPHWKQPGLGMRSA